MLTRESLLSLADTPLKPERVDTPHGTAFVPRLTAAGLTDFLDQIENASKGRELALVLVDEYGTRLFADQDAEKLARLPASFSVPVTRAFREANGLAPKDSAKPAASPTASPPTSATPT
jgi:hypothetical protein